MDAGGWMPEAGSWRLETGGWRLEAGGWRLEARGWQGRGDIRMYRKLPIRAVMDSGILALLYFDVILFDGSRAAAPKGSFRPVGEQRLEAGGRKLEARSWRPEAGKWRPEAGGRRLEVRGWQERGGHTNVFTSP